MSMHKSEVYVLRISIFLLMFIRKQDVIAIEKEVDSENVDCQVFLPTLPRGVRFQTHALPSGKFSGKFSCIDGYHFLGDSNALCDQSLNGTNKWVVGSKENSPRCAVNVAKNKPSYQSGSDDRDDLLLAASKVTSNENVIAHIGRHCSKITKASTNGGSRRGNQLNRRPNAKDSQKQWWMVDLLEELPISFINITFALDEPVVKSLEIRVGNSSEHQDNPLCMWLRGKELSGIKQSKNKYLLISCLDDFNTVGRYVSLVSNDGDSPLTLCQVKVLSTNEGIMSESLCGKGNGLSSTSQPFMTMNEHCFINPPSDQKVKRNYTDSLSFCGKHGLRPLTNTHLNSYEKMLSLIQSEMSTKQGRRMYWLGIRRGKSNGKDGTWYIDKYKDTNDQMSAKISLKEPIPWGLREPGSLGDCAAIDSGLKWKWNGLSCSVSAYVICERNGAQRCPTPRINHLTSIIGIKSDFHNVGDKLKYKCPTGYMISDGDEERTCLTNGMWSGYAPNCQYIECGEIPQDSDLSIVYLSNRTNYKALAEIGCKKIDEDGDQSFLHSSVYSSLSQTKGNRNIDYLSMGMINNNHILLTCMENGWRFLRENNVLSTTTSKYNYETERVTPTLVCVTNTCGPPNVGDNIYYDVSVDMKGDIIAKIGCEDKQQKLRVGDIHNKDNVTLVCDQPTKTWSIVSMSAKIINYKPEYRIECIESIRKTTALPLNKNPVPIKENTQPSINNLSVDENSKDIKSRNDQETDDQNKGNDGTRIHLPTCTRFAIFACVVILKLS